MVSNRGRFQNAAGFRYTPKPKKDGYCYIGLITLARKQRDVGLHRVVHVLFNDPDLKNVKPGDTVDHIDRNPLNNSASNLRWASSSLQMHNADTTPGKRGYLVRLTNKDGTVLDFCSAVEAASHIGIDSSQLSRRSAVKGWNIAHIDPDLPGEEWRDVPGICGLRVSSFGRVHNWRKSHKHFSETRKGRYVQVRGKLLHRVVLTAFGLAQPTPEHTVDHIDRNIHNNAVSNLRWATKEEQAKNKSKCRLKPMKQVEGRRVGEAAWTRYDNTLLASEATGVNRGAITGVINTGSRARTAPGSNGNRYEFRNAEDDSQSTIPGEEWLVVNPTDWVEGGAYHRMNPM